MINTHVYFPEDLYSQVSLLARQQAVPVAQVVRRFVADGVTKNKKKTDPKKGEKSPGYLALEGLTKLGIKFPKGLNLSVNYKKYLYDE